tara:strand:- start:90 stop:794 length:705 start_codon:yes stop_codon:yes gene_type:complete
MKSKNIFDNETKRDIIEWDIYNWSRAISFWESFELEISSEKKVLELGSRNGGLSLYYALKGAEVICSDVNGPSKKAEQKHIKHNVLSNVKYEKIDALNINYSSFFDVIIFKSVLGGIGRNDNINNQKKAIDQIYKALKKGGKLLFVENLSASQLHKIIRNKFITWSKAWRYISEEEMIVFLNQFSTFQLKTFGFLGTFGRTEAQKTILGILDKYFFEKILPTRMNYIITGVAIK